LFSANGEPAVGGLPLAPRSGLLLLAVIWSHEAALRVRQKELNTIATLRASICWQNHEFWEKLMVKARSFVKAPLDVTNIAAPVRVCGYFC
jgi:hypothetical protein